MLFQFLAKIFVVVFLAGVIGSMVVVLISFVEDLELLVELIRAVPPNECIRRRIADRPVAGAATEISAKLLVHLSRSLQVAPITISAIATYWHVTAAIVSAWKTSW